MRHFIYDTISTNYTLGYNSRNFTRIGVLASSSLSAQFLIQTNHFFPPISATFPLDNSLAFKYDRNEENELERNQTVCKWCSKVHSQSSAPNIKLLQEGPMIYMDLFMQQMAHRKFLFVASTSSPMGRSKAHHPKFLILIWR